jgi:hypothetical protein
LGNPALLPAFDADGCKARIRPFWPHFRPHRITPFDPMPRPPKPFSEKRSRSWIQTFRQLVRASYGPGWILREHRGGRTRSHGYGLMAAAAQ